MDLKKTGVVGIWNKKVICCFLSGLLTSLWLYFEAFRTPDYPLILQFMLVGIIPGFLFPAALLVTEDKIEFENAGMFLLLSELTYIVSAISIWITTIHDFFTPIALGCLSFFLPYCTLVVYNHFIREVPRYKNARNWIFFLGMGSMLLFTIIGYFKVHFFHPYMIHPERMEYYFHISIWCCAIWQTGFAIVVTRDK